MNILLWVMQVALAWLCIAGGIFQIFKIEQLQKNVASMRALPHSVWALFGAIGVISGVCLIVPPLFHMAPMLTPIAAAVVAAESVLISAIYLYHGDFPPLTYSVAMTVVGGFIAWGRFVLRPF